MRGTVPAIRLSTANDRSVSKDGDYVLYWMIANRRLTYNFALQRAVDWCLELGKPLVVLEALRGGYKWASVRLHQFIVEGMAANHAASKGRQFTYYPYIEQKIDDGKGLLSTLAQDACVVVSDEFPCFMLPRMASAAAAQVPVCMELVDSNGIFPMRFSDRTFSRAFDFRRYLQRHLVSSGFPEFPSADPLIRLSGIGLPEIDEKVLSRWPMNDPAEQLARGFADLPIDQSVGPAAIRGGSETAASVLDRFFEERLPLYGDERNHPDSEAASGFSPY
ncbi:MAG: deoxyribodipyrimidine photolyase, partial [Myxococcales bacterium]|nr:deoxyribodipyrimidine photolyase [Myxococcales bacterium]